MRKRTATMLTCLLLATTATTALTGCGKQPPPAEATGTLEEIAARAGCVPDIGTDAAEIRQANCRTGQARYVLATFASDRGRQEWLDQANDYGGTYLVGRQWVAVGDEPTLTALRDRLGGSVERSAGHAATPGASHGGSHGGSSGASHGGSSGGHEG
ncbi:hypothetical protein OG897_09275 [Streptomyces sp. NBC_00237]|uniref:hypothetical protein n=1 Tax=Streptomyces sp. NBC_00237 TaxID=2975687 RepID=UPI002250D5D2|nr:hypothetical protein [Streptomyces sp. NBC_00237]MCX5201639.1 hypothetical protein [Streptomyces sp. NBC_00237]